MFRRTRSPPGLWAQLTADPVAVRSSQNLWGKLRFGAGFRLSQPIAITAPKFCTIDRPFGTAFILRTVEFDVLTCNYERMNGKTKGVATGRCQGCNHPERARIERFLAAGASIKGAARKFAINYHALRRHWRNHVSAEARATYMAGAGASKDQLEEIVADESLGLLDHYRIIRGALYRSLSAACRARGR